MCECAAATACCPSRHYYGELRYKASDANDLTSRTEGVIHLYVRPTKDAPVAQPDYAVVAIEGRPLEIRLKAHDDDMTCRDVNVSIPGKGGVGGCSFSPRSMLFFFFSFFLFFQSRLESCCTTYSTTRVPFRRQLCFFLCTYIYSIVQRPTQKQNQTHMATLIDPAFGI